MTEANIPLTFLSSIENIDQAVFDWVDKEMNLFCETKDGFKKVPTLWVTPERAFLIKHNKDLRDDNGTLNLPLITVERTSISQDQKDAATFYNNPLYQGSVHYISKRINQEKTSQFANADNKKIGGINFVSPKRKNEKIVYQYTAMKLPVYIKAIYSITFFTQFQQQMNELIQPILVKSGNQRYFLIERNGYKYECFLKQEIDTKNNVNSMEEEERRYISTVTLDVVGILISNGANELDTQIKVYENPVELKISKDQEIVSYDQKQKTLDTKKAVGFLINSTNATKKTFSIGGEDISIYTLNHNLVKDDVVVMMRKDYGDYSAVQLTYEVVDNKTINIKLSDEEKNNKYYITVIG